MRTALGFLLGAAALAAQAQVKPVEPFGGRPFGAPPDATAPAPEPVSPPGTSVAPPPPLPAAVMAQPPTVVMQPGSTAVLGNAPTPVVAAPAPATPAPVPAPAPAAAAAAPAPHAPVPHAPVQQQAQGTGTPPAPAAAPAAATAQPGATTPPFAPAASTARGAAPAAASASSAQQAPVHGLPADAPRIVVSGGTYSTNPSSRLLIVNGQVVREGADLGGGVVLEQVRRDGAVLGYKGGRYNVVF